MFRCPIDFFQDNMIFTSDHSCWAIYEVRGFSYEMLSNAGKINVLNRLTLFLSSIGSEADIMMIPATQDIERQFQALAAGLNQEDPLYPVAKSNVEETCTYLKQVDEDRQRSNDYKTFAAFRLESGKDGDVLGQVKDALTFLLHTVITDINAFMASDVKDIPQARLQSCKQAASRLASEQSRRLQVVPVGPDTIQWLLRRMTYRGTSRSFPMFRRRQADKNWTPGATVVELAGKRLLRPRPVDVVNLVSGDIRQEDRFLRIDHGDGETSWQTFLAMTGIPEEHFFPGDEWLYKLQKKNYNAEIYLHIRAIEHREGIKKVENQQQMAKSQTRNISEAEENIPTDLLESMEDIEGVQAELKAGKYPLLETSVTICVAGTDRNAVDDEANRIRQMYEDDHFVVERPLADQLSLFFQCIPGVSFTVKDYIQYLPPRALASGIFGATRELGSPVGNYIGTTGEEGKHVFFDMRRACLNNLSACTTFYGNLGYGKSFNANLLLYLHVLYGGGYGLVIDPKGERTHWPTALHGLQGWITLVELSPQPEFKGCLDPFNVFRTDINEACELAENVLTELYKIQPKDMEYLALKDALERIKSEERPSMQRLAELLEAFPETDELLPEGRRLARRIRLQQSSGMAQLLIGDGTEDAIRLDNRLNILQIQNMKLPSPDISKEEYTQEETVSSVLMMVITAFCKRFVHSHPGRFKIVLLDESWFMTKTPEGEKLISYISRMSRSLYCSLILNGHSVTDLPNAGVRNAITFKFCFHVDDQEEADRMLQFMGLEVTPENLYTLMNLENGQALFRDMEGRVGVLTFDAIFSDLIDAFATTPSDEMAQAQEQAAKEGGRERA